MHCKAESALYEWMRSTQLPKAVVPVYHKALVHLLHGGYSWRDTLSAMRKGISQCANESTVDVTRIGVEFYGFRTFLECVHCLPPVRFKNQDFDRIPFTYISPERKKYVQ